MNYFSSIVRNVKEFYSEINAATLTGAIDVIVVEQEDGTFRCSPFHVRFGKLGVLKAREKIVELQINGCEVPLQMKLDDAGTAFFVENVEGEDESWNVDLATSPLPDPGIAAASFGGRAGKMTPQRLFQPDPLPDGREELDFEISNLFLEPESSKSLTTAGSSVQVKSDVDSRKGRLNRKKRKRRNQLKHTRKGSKCSLKEILLDDEMFPMDDVNDADQEDELGGSEPEYGSESVALDLEFFKRLELKKSESCGVSKVVSVPESTAVVTNQNEETELSNTKVDSHGGKVGKEMDGEVGQALEPMETVYVDTSRPNFHYFSDGEEAPSASKPRRPPSPSILSDSELERAGPVSETDGVWRWGELPTTAPTTPTTPTAEEVSKPDPASQQSGAGRGGWWWNSGAAGTEEKPVKESSKGVYLDDIVANPDLQAIYLAPPGRAEIAQDPLVEPGPADPVAVEEPVSDDDCESRGGLSLPMSPGAKYDSDCEQDLRLKYEADLPSLISRHLPDLAASRCGGLTDASITPHQFETNLVTYAQFLDCLSTSGANSFMNDPNLVIRVHEKYLSWDKASPILLSVLLFKQPLPADLVTECIKDGLDVNINISPEELSAKKVENAENRKTSSWFGWFGSSKNGSSSREGNIKIEEIDEEAKQENSIKKEIIEEEPVQTTRDDCENILPADAFISEAGVGGELPDADDDKKYRKSMRLSSEQISQLNLRPGSNEVEFSVTTAFQGTTRATCHIYLWRHSDKIVISDIDGTITKSDVLGHFLPVIGQIWAQAGVAKLFSKIHDNGYKIMYLSARALGQATITKDYLHSVKQGDVCLPDGPIFLNPDSLIHAFRREVIDRNPEEFKIRCLKDI